MSAEVREIPLRGALGSGLVAFVDAEDYDRVVAAGPWYALRKPHGVYARTHTPSRRRSGFYFMHNVVMGVRGVDHINHNTLDNQKRNLRHATGMQNGANQQKARTNRGRPTSSRFKGVVYWVNKSGTPRWRARIVVAGKAISLGCFDFEIEAAAAYNMAAVHHFGSFAHLNDLVLTSPAPHDSNSTHLAQSYTRMCGVADFVCSRFRNTPSIMGVSA